MEGGSQYSELTRGYRYDDVGKACVIQLLSVLRNDTAEKTTWMKVCDVVDAHFKGDLDHVADTLSLLWQTANEVCNTSTTSDSRPSVHLFPIHLDVDADSDSSDRLSISIAPQAVTPSRPRC